MNFILKNTVIVLVLLNSISCKEPSSLLKNAENLMETAPDSALQLLKTTKIENFYLPSEKALYALLYCQALDKNDQKIESDSLLSFAIDYYDEDEPEKAGYSWFYHSRLAINLGDANEQALSLLKALEYSKKTNNYELLGLVLGEKGDMYKNQNRLDSSIYYYKLSYESFKKIGDIRNSILNLQSIGNQYSILKNFSEALKNYKLAEKLSQNLNDDNITSYINRCLGNLYLDQRNFKKSLYYFQNSPKTNTEIYNSNKWCLISNVFVQSGNLDSARHYIYKVKEINGMELDYYSIWQQIYEKEGNLTNALRFATKIIKTKDSIYNQKLDISFASIEKKYDYQKFQLANKDLKLQNSKKSVIILIVLLLLSSFIIGFLYWRNILKHRQLNIEKELLKQESLRAEKEHENTILLEKQLKLQKIVVSNLEQYRKNALKLPTKIKNGFSPIENSDFQNELIEAIDLEYNNFTKRISQQYESLSQIDILICCLLLANFDTGMISSILGIKTASMNIKRSRLRQKLNIVSSVNLTNFLRSF